MGCVQVSTVGAGNKGSSELNSHPVGDGKKDSRDVGSVGDGQGFSEEDESRVNGMSKDLNNGHPPALRSVQTAAQHQQQPLGPVVRWERFLPLPSLKVLLVENDDSTRQVVSALLRNCSYEVTTTANGIQAWKILEDLTNHIDLVLTEVVMPCLSGIGLLTKIMSHKTLKNIPVIMMSSHDSMGVVFKCLSKGAVDFLVKPIRKNELKNLWQHVWRRCHSSSGSGSESGIQTQKSTKSKSDDESDNHTGSNDEDDNASTGLRDGSDNGSGTQSSWTKRAIEVESPQQMSTWDQLADPHDSTCAQVIHPKPETFGNEWVPMTAIGAFEETKEQLTENVEMGKDLEIGIPTNRDLQPESSPKKKISTNISVIKEKIPPQDPKKDMQSNHELLELKSSIPSSKLRAQPASLVGDNINSSNITQMDTKAARASNCLSKTTEIKGKAAPELPSFELSLKRLRAVGEGGSSNQEERTILRRSDLSAFSRYNTTNAATQATGYGANSPRPLDNSSDAMKTESLCNIQSNSNTAPLNQRSNGSSNNNDMGSTTENAFTKPATAALKDKSVSVSTAKGNHLSAFQIVQHSRNYTTHQVISEKVDNVVAAGVGQPSGPQHQMQVRHHHHHHYHQHHHHIHSLQLQPTPGPEDLSVKNMAAAVPQCGSSNVLGGAVEVNAGNYSLNGSVSGSNHGSNGQNGSSIAVNTGAVNMESDNGATRKSGAGGGSGSRSGTGVDQNRVAQREAALNKFRQKRKQRCFEKKVHYQSRKRLAEQRPRVRGQFVRQNFYEHANQDTDC